MVAYEEFLCFNAGTAASDNGRHGTVREGEWASLLRAGKMKHIIQCDQTGNLSVQKRDLSAFMVLLQIFVVAVHDVFGKGFIAGKLFLFLWKNVLAVILLPTHV